MEPCVSTGPISGWISQFVAFCDVQLSEADPPFVMEGGESDRLLVGAGGSGAATVMCAALIDVPPGPLHDRE